MLRRLLALALAGAVAAASAAELGAPPGTPDNSNIPDVPEWKEVDAPPPPPLRTTGLIPIDVAGSGALRFAVDPASISIGKDDVVRYVVVASSRTGTVNGLYEGIRCGSGQVKVYARHNPDTGWVPASNSDWQDVFKVANSRHSLAIARSGVCQENAPNVSATQIIQDLKAPIDRRFERGGTNR